MDKFIPTLRASIRYLFLVGLFSAFPVHAEDPVQPPPAYLKAPRQVLAAGGYTCVLDEEGMKCWGMNYSGAAEVPKGLKNPAA